MQTCLWVDIGLLTLIGWLLLGLYTKVVAEVVSTSLRSEAKDASPVREMGKCYVPYYILASLLILS